MAPNAQCSEDGPFFPTTPRYVIQNGMSVEQDILQSPDWVLIALMCVAILLTVIVVIIALVRVSSCCQLAVILLGRHAVEGVIVDYVTNTVLQQLSIVK